MLFFGVVLVQFNFLGGSGVDSVGVVDWQDRVICGIGTGVKERKCKWFGNGVRHPRKK